MAPNENLSQRQFTLNNRSGEIPALGFGTSLSDNKKTRNAVLPAFHAPGSNSEPAGAGGGNRFGGGGGQFPVPHAVEHPFHDGDDLRCCSGESGFVGCGDLVGIDACPGQHGGRVCQLIGQPGQRVG
jgi:hypothetical protein